MPLLEKLARTQTPVRTYFRKWFENFTNFRSDPSKDRHLGLRWFNLPPKYILGTPL
ncbi:hypothetical protein J6590_092134, partial [Homalodisca vitripennis]